MKTLVELMARSVGARPQQNKNCDVEYLMSTEALEAFAELVRADERARMATDKSKEAMKLAKAWFERNTYGDEAVDVYEALCEALAEQYDPDLQDKDPDLVEQPAQQEPVAWMYPDDYERMSTSETFCTVYSVEVGSATRGESTVALYTSPPAQRKLLTDEEMAKALPRPWPEEDDRVCLSATELRQFVHNIKENT